MFPHHRIFNLTHQRLSFIILVILFFTVIIYLIGLIRTKNHHEYLSGRVDRLNSFVEQKKEEDRWKGNQSNRKDSQQNKAGEQHMPIEKEQEDSFKQKPLDEILGTDKVGYADPLEEIKIDWPLLNEDKKGEEKKIVHNFSVADEADAATKWNNNSYMLIHGNSGSRVYGKIESLQRILPSYVNEDLHLIRALRLPKKTRDWPCLGNGHLGGVVYSSVLYKEGLFNGRYHDSHRAKIPSTISFNISAIENETGRHVTFDLASGIFSQFIVGKGFNITQMFYIHRSIPELIVAEIDVERSFLKVDPVVKIVNKRWAASIDLSFVSKTSGMAEVSYKVGVVNAPEEPRLPAEEVHVLYDHVPDQLVMPTTSLRVKWIYLTVIGSDRAQAFDVYERSKLLIHDMDGLHRRHVEGWADLWASGRIEVTGNAHLSRAVFASQYALLSSTPLPEWNKDFVGLAPSGLAYGGGDDGGLDYQGHVFWDQEIWMMPALLPLHSDIGKMIVKTRLRTMENAERNARRYSLKGLKYPWESAKTGVEVCNSSLYPNQEIHISGDVSLAALRYLQLTHDSSFVSEGVHKMLDGIASFWATQVRYNATSGMNGILDVMGPDEYHAHVNNSAFTNVIANVSLSAPNFARRLVNVTAQAWQHITASMHVPYSPQYNYHPEFDGYRRGTKVKQADAILLRYPLGYQYLSAIYENDLNYYETVTDVMGPAMTASMFAIGWLDVGQDTKAEVCLNRSAAHMHGDFMVWSETRLGGARNFITGAGGFLQAIIYGYGGLRIRDDRLDFNPKLPSGVEDMRLLKLDYMKAVVDVNWSAEEVVVVLWAAGLKPLKVKVHATEQIFNLEVGRSVRFTTRPFAVVPAGPEMSATPQRHK